MPKHYYRRGMVLTVSGFELDSTNLPVVYTEHVLSSLLEGSFVELSPPDQGNEVETWLKAAGADVDKLRANVSRSLVGREIDDTRWKPVDSFVMKAFEKTMSIGVHLKYRTGTSQHFLFGLVAIRKGKAYDLIVEAGADPEKLLQLLAKRIAEGPDRGT